MMETKPVFSGRMTAAIVAMSCTPLAIVGAIVAYEDGIGAVVPGAISFLVLAMLTLLGMAAGRRTRYVLVGIVVLAFVALDAAAASIFSRQMVLISGWHTWLMVLIVALVLYWRDRRNGPDVSAS